MLQTIDRWHKTKIGYLVFGLIELTAAYALASLAIDRGSWWWYAGTLILLVGSLQNFTKVVSMIVKSRR